MVEVLGIVGSARRWDNSELMVRQALEGALAEGATAQMIRLTSLRLESCTGCMRCVLGGRSCPLEDDMSWLVGAIQAADGLVLAAPTYFLGPAAVIKLVLDRLLMVTGRIETDLPAPRPAVTIATAGLEDWRGVTLPYLNAIVGAFGYRAIESLNAVAPGPGEVLLDDELMARTWTAGRRLGRSELEPSPAPPNVCPTCHCDSFILRGDLAICPICGREALIVPSGATIALSFDRASGTNHRWTPDALRRHMSEWVMATGPRFMDLRSEIKARRAPHRKVDIGWVCPPPDATLSEE
ncbi:MAG: flavodoxin family protein [Anaerolineae bacterium]